MHDDRRIEEVLTFWFGAPDSAARNKSREEWFRKNEAFDREIAKRFGPLIDEALEGGLGTWEASQEGAVAKILTLDQFPRNVFRGRPRAFAGDAKALTLARALVQSGRHRSLPGVWRQFVYLPFEHAEDLAAQAESLRLFAQLGRDAPELAGLLAWAEKHQVIVARFGRFPHRNAILGRRSTPEEEAFLNEPGSSF
jgi:uncharacterized protein (DUF924 family)